MSKTLQQIRKDAGFKSAREFAESAGIAVSTYTRYEQQPDTIPLKAAWELADRFGCSIDAVVGRTEPDPDAMRGEVQKFHDSLSEPNRKLHDEFMAFLSVRESQAVIEMKRLEKESLQVMLELLEQAFAVSVLQSGKMFDSAFSTAKEKRAAFEAFLGECVDEGKIKAIRSDGKEAVKGFMADYDEKHASGVSQVNYGFIEF